MLQEDLMVVDQRVLESRLKFNISKTLALSSRHALRTDHRRCIFLEQEAVEQIKEAKLLSVTFHGQLMFITQVLHDQKMFLYVYKEQQQFKKYCNPWSYATLITVQQYGLTLQNKTLLRSSSLKAELHCLHSLPLNERTPQRRCTVFG